MGPVGQPGRHREQHPGRRRHPDRQRLRRHLRPAGRPATFTADDVQVFFRDTTPTTSPAGPVPVTLGRRRSTPARSAPPSSWSTSPRAAASAPTATRSAPTIQRPDPRPHPHGQHRRRPTGQPRPRSASTDVPQPIPDDVDDPRRPSPVAGFPANQVVAQPHGQPVDQPHRRQRPDPHPDRARRHADPPGRHEPLRRRRRRPTNFTQHDLRRRRPRAARSPSGTAPFTGTFRPDAAASAAQRPADQRDLDARGRRRPAGRRLGDAQSAGR